MSKSPDLSIIGKTFNELKVIECTDKRNGQNRILYRCECLRCGGEKLATKANLKRGEIKNCGCKRHEPKNNLVGKIYGNLKVKNYKVVNNKLMYECECLLCGKTTDVMPGDLVSGKKKTCGNHNKGKEAKIKKLFIEGTEPTKLENPERLRATNTSGRTGVYYDKTRKLWCAEIMFKRKKYYLGRYKDIKEAIKVRKKAEEEIFGEFLNWYQNDFLKGKEEK